MKSTPTPSLDADLNMLREIRSMVDCLEGSIYLRKARDDGSDVLPTLDAHYSLEAAWAEVHFAQKDFVKVGLLKAAP